MPMDVLFECVFNLPVDRRMFMLAPTFLRQGKDGAEVAMLIELLKIQTTLRFPRQSVHMILFNDDGQRTGSRVSLMQMSLNRPTKLIDSFAEASAQSHLPKTTPMHWRRHRCELAMPGS